MTRFLGVYIGAGFGLAFVLANAGPPLDPTLALVLRVLAVAALIGIVVLTLLLARRPAPEGGTPEGDTPALRFGPFYGAVVAAEVVLIIGGFQVLRLLGLPEQANVCWIALVVGLHFFPLAWYWRTREILVVALYLSVLGAAGLTMVATGHPDWAPFVSGVLSGVGMLGGLLVSLIGPFLAGRRGAEANGT
ncbi:hypothetical protein DFP74_2561 [Nocardiopsis sp. Huas11]|uniref:hypothetical protein n=1 Tax=Nocardiopsis sp. Huas11 TaxID=2183912 RepID=UPI000EB42396|nr:hypothetical protein [Nocardiopsis sp. Huas11]RKS06911.1 hypothetical protein DFP74_2561 [Nocardiopsis sp. Huas11]